MGAPILLLMIVRMLVLIGVCYMTDDLSQDGSRRLLGKWRSLETSKGGIGAIVNFRVMAVSITALVQSSRGSIEWSRTV